ncbi:MAG: hypothetical protein FT714_08510 [Pantoea sp. Pent]|nr:hypothetical protein [Pantoea sp. Pent]
MIVVTTPTGNIGAHVVQLLLNAGEPLRLIVRDASKLTKAVRESVEIVEGSHGDAAIVDRVFRGADAVFWLCPPTPAPTPAAATIDFARPGPPLTRCAEPASATSLQLQRLVATRPGSTARAMPPGRFRWSICCAKPGALCVASHCQPSWITRGVRSMPFVRGICSDRSILTRNCRTPPHVIVPLPPLRC